jgi:hypothetical protein
VFLFSSKTRYLQRAYNLIAITHIGETLPKTSLYIPAVELTIGDEDGFKLLYDSLVQSGPAYRLIVHDIPTWHEIRDKIQNPEEIVILTEKQAEYYKQASKDFFAPIVQTYPRYEDEQGVKATVNLVSEMSCALSYILIASDYHARIFEDDILEYYNPIADFTRWGVSEDLLNRVNVIDTLLKGYTETQIPSVYMNRKEAQIANLKELLLKEEMSTLSTLNYQFGEIVVDKQVLIRDIDTSIKVALKSAWLPHVIGGCAVALSYFAGMRDVDLLAPYLAGLVTTVLSKIKFKEYIPPIENPQLYALGEPTDGVQTFSSSRFNTGYVLLKER